MGRRTATVKSADMQNEAIEFCATAMNDCDIETHVAAHIKKQCDTSQRGTAFLGGISPGLAENTEVFTDHGTATDPK
ncbi:hypothetical protein X801_02411 [Opisthorchis viverrini]|uniref:Uncharacterized protein n=1 Tax=Opisthorchis viverrini TaxID=6198 RepID=A0A1S8X4P9_OPIVI|nr:hypothetical protein X801_02411 [Opisthorchis viverrini]